MPKINDKPLAKFGGRLALIRQGGRAGAMLLCACGLSKTAIAQQILVPIPALSLTPSALLDSNSGIKTAENPTGATIVPGSLQLFQWGPVSVHPHADYQFTYGTGLESSPGSQQASVVQTFTPGVTFDLGTHWTLDYTPSFQYYSSSQFSDTVSQNVSLTGGGNYGDWKYGLTQSYSESSDPQVQTGTQTETDIYSTGFNGSYAFSSAISMDFSFNQTLNNAPGFQSYDEWSTSEYVNYQFLTRLTVGVGGGATYDHVVQSSDQVSENLNLRVQWEISRKTSFSISGGLEDQQFIGGGVPSTLTPIFGVTASYSPFQFTTLSLNGNRSISPSLLLAQVVTTTTVGVGLNQRLLKNLSLSVDLSYDESSYSSSEQQFSTSRTDDYYSLNTRLSWTFLKRANASIFYQYSINQSSENMFAFTSNQVGFEIGYSF